MFKGFFTENPSKTRNPPMPMRAAAARSIHDGSVGRYHSPFEKLLFMLRLALVHRGSHAFLAAVAAAVAAWCSARKMARLCLRRRAETRLLTLATSAPASRVQSACHLPSLAMGSSLTMVRSQSLMSLTPCKEEGRPAEPATRETAELPRRPSEQSLVALAETHELCEMCLSRCATYEQLTQLDAAVVEADASAKAPDTVASTEEAPLAKMLFGGFGPLPPIAQLGCPVAPVPDRCEVCCEVQGMWSTIARAALKLSLAAGLSYLLWLRFVASRQTIRRHVGPTPHPAMPFPPAPHPLRRLPMPLPISCRCPCRCPCRPSPPASQLFAITRVIGERFFSYQVVGGESIPRDGPAVLCVYHGFIPLDMYFLHEWVVRTTGRTPTTLVADFVFRIPIFGELVRACGGVPASRAAALDALRNGMLVIVAPGGVREAMTASSEDYTPCWYGRSGFAEVAQLVGAPIIPLFTRNIREVFLVLGGSLPIVQKLYRLTKLPFTPFLGPLPQPLTSIIGQVLPHNPALGYKEVASSARESLEALMRAHSKAP